MRYQRELNSGKVLEIWTRVRQCSIRKRRRTEKEAGRVERKRRGRRKVKRMSEEEEGRGGGRKMSEEMQKKE